MRGSNSVKLTEAGELFYEEAREVLARADDAIRCVRGEKGKEILRVGYRSSMATRLISTVLAKFQAAAPRVRIELADLSSKEVNELAGGGRLDLVICPGPCVANGIPGFQLTELCRLQPVLVLPASHPLAKLKRTPDARLRHLPLIGLAKDHFPEYVPSARALLKPFGVTPRFVSLVNDKFSTLLVELEAHNAAAILLEGIAGILPQTLVLRPFTPKLPSVAVVIGLLALRPKPHAERSPACCAKKCRGWASGTLSARSSKAFGFDNEGC